MVTSHRILSADPLTLSSLSQCARNMDFLGKDFGVQGCTIITASPSSSSCCLCPLLEDRLRSSRAPPSLLIEYHNVSRNWHSTVLPFVPRNGFSDCPKIRDVESENPSFDTPLKKLKHDTSGITLEKSLTERISKQARLFTHTHTCRSKVYVVDLYEAFLESLG